MTTALDIGTDALVRMGVYAPGEALSDADAATMLAVLNDMLDSWSNESLACYARAETSVVLTVNKYRYTIGIGGSADINATRPLRILDSPGTAYILDTNNNRYPMDVLNQDQWNLIGNIASVNSNIPSKLFYDPQYPLGIVNVFPVPNIGWTLYFDSLLQLTEFAELTSAMSLPPGYSRALKANLAIELWPYFKPDGSQPGAALIKAALDSKGNIKRTNIKDVTLVYDPELIARARSSYNIYKDGPSYG